MAFLKKIFLNLSAQERKFFFVSLALFVIALATETAFAIHDHSVFVPIRGGSYHEGFVGQPIALNPIVSNNPIDQEMSALLFTRLGNLLSGYDVSRDGKSYTLNLKENLLWSDGQPLTSDDVVFTIHTIQNPMSNSPLAKNWQGVAVARVSQLQTKLTLPSSYAFFPDNFLNLPVIPQHSYGSIPVENFRLSSYNLEPVGNGPYVFKSFSKRKDGFITTYHLVMNKNYAGAKPYITDFYFDFFQSTKDLLAALTTHDVNAYGTAAPLPFDASQMKGLVVERIPTPNYYAVFFNETSNPFLKDKSLREALIEAVDQQAIVQDALGGNATPVYGPHLTFQNGTIAPGNPTSNPTDAASRIAAFKAAHQRETIALTLSVPDAPFLKKVADDITRAWTNAGIDSVNIQTFNPNDLSDTTVSARSYDALLFGNVFQNQDDLFPFWHSSQRAYPGYNLALYANQNVDTAIETARETQNDTTRAAAIKEATSRITNDAPALFLFSLPYTYVHTPSLHGFSTKPITVPAGRFANADQWYTAQVRVIR